MKNNLTEIKKHIEILNEEMGTIKTDIAVIKNDIGWLKTWGLGILVIIQVVVSVIVNKVL